MLRVVQRRPQGRESGGVINLGADELVLGCAVPQAFQSKHAGGHRRADGTVPVGVKFCPQPIDEWRVG